MPVKARRAKTRAHAITPAAVRAFIDGDSLALHDALGLQLCDISPLDVDVDSICPFPPSTGAARSWPLVLRLRAELEAATRD